MSPGAPQVLGSGGPHGASTSPGRPGSSVSSHPGAGPSASTSKMQFSTGQTSSQLHMFSVCPQN